MMTERCWSIIIGIEKRREEMWRDEAGRAGQAADCYCGPPQGRPQAGWPPSERKCKQNLQIVMRQAARNPQTLSGDKRTVASARQTVAQLETARRRPPAVRVRVGERAGAVRQARRREEARRQAEMQLFRALTSRKTGKRQGKLKNIEC